MGRVKQAAAKALADHLSHVVPALAGKTSAVQAAPDGISSYPTLAVLPEAFRADWHSSIAELLDAAGEPIGDDAAPEVEVGHLAGGMQLWLAARYSAEREDLEGAVLHAFAADDAVPGRILLSCNTGLTSAAVEHEQPVGFLLGRAEWREEFAFSERRWAILSVEVDLPIRVSLASAPVVRQYLLDLETDIADVAVGAQSTDLASISAGGH